MKPILENWSVVLIGHWNLMIFTPDWIAKQVFEAEEVQVEFPVANPLMPFRYSCQGVYLVITDERIVLAPSANDDAILQRLEVAATRILNKLPHTPIRAVGLNYEFAEQEPETEVAALFKLRDSGVLADYGFIVQKTELARRLTNEHGDVLRLRLHLHDGVVTFKFNFHHDVTDATTAAQRIEGQLIGRRDLSFKLMQDVYHLEQGESK